MSERRIAAFGGTFDPIHNGHVEVARAAVTKFELDRLLIIPAYKPPHKGLHEISSSYHRHAMAVLASMDEPRVYVSTIELDEPGQPYTYQTMGRLQNTLGAETKLFFIVGADSFEEINTWREPARLLSSASLIVVTRPGHDVSSSHLEERFRSTIVDLRDNKRLFDKAASPREHHIYLTNCVSTDVSSTEIRGMASGGESIVGRVPQRVADYIDKYELYRGAF